ADPGRRRPFVDRPTARTRKARAGGLTILSLRSCCEVLRPRWQASPTRNSGEGRTMLLDERLERHGRASAKLLDQVVRASEDAILVVDRDLSEVLEQEGILAARILPARLQGPAELLEVHLLEVDVLAEHPAQDLRRLAVGVFGRAEEGIDLPLVGNGVLQDAGDDAALVLGGDRGVLAGAERHVEPAGLDHRG